MYYLCTTCVFFVCTNLWKKVLVSGVFMASSVGKGTVHSVCRAAEANVCVTILVPSSSLLWSWSKCQVSQVVLILHITFPTGCGKSPPIHISSWNPWWALTQTGVPSVNLLGQVSSISGVWLPTSQIRSYHMRIEHPNIAMARYWFWLNVSEVDKKSRQHLSKNSFFNFL